VTWFEAILIAIIEGLTEFLPVSSTAHMIFLSSIFGIQDESFVKLYQVSIQFGAILSVVWLYRHLFFDFSSFDFYKKIILATVPALILGKLFDDKIDAILEKPLPIAIVLVLGGIVMLFVHNLWTKPHILSTKSITYKQAITIGIWQCLAMMPGTSRSAASIIGGLSLGFDKKTASEFSFFLAVPTMFAVTCYSLFLKSWEISSEQTQKGFMMLSQNQELLAMFLVGNFIAFLVSVFAIKFMMNLLQQFGFKIWGWYRIILGICLILYFYLR
jgi:undecaprenyl-diphosphatase